MAAEKMYIEGRWVESDSGETFPDNNPATGELYAEVAKGGRADADRALASAYAARKTWAATPATERAKMLYQASATLQRRLEEFAGVLIAEGGSMFGKAMFEASYTVDLLHTAGEHCKQLLGQTMPSEQDRLSMTIYRPLGTVAAVSPWNFPLLLSVNKVAYALAAGNTVILKPSSDTPVIGLKLASLFEEIGLPPGVFNVITGPGGELGEALATDDRVSLITLTGSTPTGKKVAQKAAAHLKKYTLELGGKDPLIILGDADLDYAVNAAAFGAFMHQGQICMSVERIIVEQSIAEEFANRLAAKAATLPIGDPSLPTTVIGPLINDEQVQKVHAQVEDALARGARVLTGGTYDQRFYAPTVLADVTRDMLVAREETFGPLAPVIAVKDVAEALEVANDTPYGLSSGVITNDIRKALFLAEGLEAGMVHINDSSVNDEPHCPFGGCKDSGIGREGGRHSMEAMSEIKWVTIQRAERQYPF